MFILTFVSICTVQTLEDDANHENDDLSYSEVVRCFNNDEMVNAPTEERSTVATKRRGASTIQSKKETYKSKIYVEYGELVYYLGPTIEVVIFSHKELTNQLDVRIIDCLVNFLRLKITTPIADPAYLCRNW